MTLCLNAEHDANCLLCVMWIQVAMIYIILNKESILLERLVSAHNSSDGAAYCRAAWFTSLRNDEQTVMGDGRGMLCWMSFPSVA